VSNLPSLFHHRWAVPILAELERAGGARFVTLAHRLGVSRESLTRTLAALIGAGLVERNPGYGHPLRPEYVLTANGRRLGQYALTLVEALAAADAAEIGLRKWSMPVVLALSHDGGRRFSELHSALPGSTPRAMTLALKGLVAAGLLERTVTEDFPPATVYRLTPRAGAVAAAVRALDHQLTRETRPRPSARPRRGGRARP
jgi:DNA-binding HxlR family transcriptional regulator